MVTREYVGAGGTRLHLDEPLSPQMAEQIAKGQLQPVVASPADPVEATGGAPGEGLAEGPAAADRPAKSAPVAEWRAYAVARGMSEDDAAAATKAECQDYVQVLDEAAGE